LVSLLGIGQLEDRWQGWGLEATKINPQRSSATELCVAFESLFTGGWVSPQASELILGWLAASTLGDETRLGLLRQRLPLQSVIYNQRGSLAAWPRVVGDSGLVHLPDGSMFFFTLHGVGKSAATTAELEATFDQAVAIFADFLNAQ
jgi:hypothetical protein